VDRSPDHEGSLTMALGPARPLNKNDLQNGESRSGGQKSKEENPMLCSSSLPDSDLSVQSAPDVRPLDDIARIKLAPLVRSLRASATRWSSSADSSVMRLGDTLAATYLRVQWARTSERLIDVALALESVANNATALGRSFCAAIISRIAQRLLRIATASARRTSRRMGR